MSKATIYSARVVEAFALMHELHHAQYRKGGDIPYITHLMAVAVLIGEHGGDEETFIAALLHDAAEDQGGEAIVSRIREAFGDKVAELVKGASDSFEDPKPPWRERKETHITHMREASPKLRMLLCADKIHNIRAIISDLGGVIGSGDDRQHQGDKQQPDDGYWRRFKGGKAGTLWYYQAACEALGKEWSHPLHDLLQREVKELEKLAS